LNDDDLGLDDLEHRLWWMRERLGEALEQPDAADEPDAARDILRIGVTTAEAHAVLGLLGELGRVEQGDLSWLVLED
jgi:hypothetical protein